VARSKRPNTTHLPHDRYLKPISAGSQQQVCREYELLVAEIDAKFGGFGIVPASLDGAIVSSHYFLFRVNSSLLDVSFLGYYLKTRALNYCRAPFTSSSSGRAETRRKGSEA
jgi:hypothetical protein